MSSSGPLSPSGSGQFSTGDVAWTNESNTASENATGASADINMGLVSHQLYATNFGFSLPSSATISGITVEIKRKCLFGAAFDSAVYLMKAGFTVGTNKNAAGYWPASYTYRTYGGTSDLWGTTWTYSDINLSNFGVAIAATADDFDTASVDHIRVTVEYTTVGAYVLTASSGPFTLTGQAASLIRSRRINASAGSFVLTGQDATLRRTQLLSADAGSYTLTGTAASPLAARKLTASAGSYTFTGQSASLYRYAPLTASAGSYTLTGTAAGLVVSRKITASAGSYALTGTSLYYRRVIPTVRDSINFPWQQGDIVAL